MTTQLPIYPCFILSLLLRNVPWLDSTCTSCIADNLSRIYRFVNVSGLWMFQVDRCLSTVTPDSWVEFASLTVRTREKWWYTSGWSGLKITSPPKLKSCKVRRSLPRPIFQATSPGQFSHANPPYNGEIITCMYQPMKKLDVPYILTLSPSACIYFGCFRCYDQSRGRELFSR